MVTSAASARTHSHGPMKKHTSLFKRPAPKHAAPMFRTDAEGKWRPGTVKLFYSDWNENAEYIWASGPTYVCTYRDNGTLESMETDGYVTYYSEYGEETLRLSDYSKTEYQYDARLPHVCIMSREYERRSTESEWELIEEDRMIIERDAAGNVVSTAEMSLNDGELRPDGYVSEITYGSDGKASTIKLDYSDTWDSETVVVISGIVWDRTDGQIVLDDDDLDDMNLFSGANRIASATFRTDELPQPVQLTVTYSGDDYELKVTMDGQVIASMDYKSLDEFGSYECTSTEVDYDYDYDLGQWVMDEMYSYYEMEQYDGYGLTVAEKDIEYDEYGEIEYHSEMTSDIVYEPTFGYPVSYESTFVNYYSDDEPSYYPGSKMEFGDYRLYTALTEIDADSADTDAVYYNLQGVRIDSPAAGIYIRVTGDRATKVVIR